MTKPEWGSKHTCQSCKAKYYDFLKSPITCPKCGTVFDAGAGKDGKKVASESNVVEMKATEIDDADDLDNVAEFPDEEELVHIDDADDVDNEDDEDLQTVNAGAGGMRDE
ncbi:TIGR02300 family protein [Kiloniella sp.]|uniref:TIGR02300 family protein n=1 Tax=Kiloniella sp. TaxID=1938587 RepID=UPI003B020516